MREDRGDLWDAHAAGYWICITTNGDVNASGRAVMGRGVALQAAQRFPRLPSLLAKRLIHGNHVTPFSSMRIITFPVKNHWSERADLNLIRRSCKELMAVMNDIRWGIDRIYLPRPGCGNGHLDWHDARDVIYNRLDDRVIVITNGV